MGTSRNLGCGKSAKATSGISKISELTNSAVFFALRNATTAEIPSRHPSTKTSHGPNPELPHTSASHLCPNIGISLVLNCSQHAAPTTLQRRDYEYQPPRHSTSSNSMRVTQAIAS